RFARTRVTLHIHRQEDNNVALTIEDDGPGLTNEDCQLLSQRGVSRDEASDQHQGLGLHICQAVVDSYGGTMTLQTERAGLKICVTLPA
ncbi:MAG: ATP-binding protein, partial [Reinekea sp.]|nr:ATP-binding protein [Reinekea sp.]